MSQFYDNPGQINDEAINIAGGKTFQVFQLADADGNVIDPMSAGSITVDNVTISNEVEVSNDDGNPVPVSVPGLQIPSHDYIALTYTGSNLTGVAYKTGGSGGTIVASLALAYDGGNNLISVTKS